MANRLGWFVGLAACVMWAIGLGWQNEAENVLIGVPVPVAENNTYWARDFRFAAVLLAIAALVLIAHGGWAVSAAALGVLVGWISVDVALDRADFALAWLAAVSACVWFAIVAWALPRRRGTGGSLYFWSLAVVFLAVYGGMFMQTNDDLVPLRTALAGGVLAVLAIATAGALAVASSGRPWTWGRVAVCAALSVMVCAYTVWRHFNGEPQLWWVLLPPVALLLAGMVLLAGRQLLRVLPLLALAALPFVASVLYVTLIFTGWPVADAVTAAAGSPPVHGADIDVLLSVYLFLIGVVIALGLLPVTRVRAKRPPEQASVIQPEQASVVQPG